MGGDGCTRPGALTSKVVDLVPATSRTVGFLGRVEVTAETPRTDPALLHVNDDHDDMPLVDVQDHPPSNRRRGLAARPTVSRGAARSEMEIPAGRVIPAGIV
jgi:hypothetical protein